MLVKHATLWLFTLPISPCNLYVFFTSHFQLTLALARDVALFLLLRSQCYNCVQRIYVCIYVKYTFVCIPHRDIYHTLSGICVHTTPLQ